MKGSNRESRDHIFISFLWLRGRRRVNTISSLLFFFFFQYPHCVENRQPALQVTQMLAAALFHSQWQLLPGLCCHHSLHFSNLIAGQCHGSYQIHSYLYGNMPLITRAAFCLFFFSGKLLWISHCVCGNICCWRATEVVFRMHVCSRVDGRKKNTDRHWSQKKKAK